MYDAGPMRVNPEPHPAIDQDRPLSISSGNSRRKESITLMLLSRFRLSFSELEMVDTYIRFGKIKKEELFLHLKSHQVTSVRMEEEKRELFCGDFHPT